jgi:hypothetical protein
MYRMKKWAAFSLDSAGLIVANNGAVLSVVATATGVRTITLAAGYAIDATESAVIGMERGVMAASGISSFGMSHTSDTVKVLRSLREGAAGAASALADIACDVVIFNTKGGDDPPA